MSINWSSYQEGIFKTVYTPYNVLVNAKAGTGKSTVVEEYILRYRNEYVDNTVLVLAFNTKIAEEMGARLNVMGQSVKAATYHSYGYSLVKEFAESQGLSSRINASKYYFAAKGFHDDYDYVTVITDVLVKIRALNMFDLSVTSLGELIDNNRDTFRKRGKRKGSDILAFLTNNIVDLIELSEACDNDVENVTFYDMIRLPVIHKLLRGTQYNLVAVDEIQDTDPGQYMFLQELGITGCKFLLVGDKDQAIYQFRGAIASAVDDAVEMFDCTSLELPQTYRCPPEVVQFVLNRLELSTDFISAKPKGSGSAQELPILVDNANIGIGYMSAISNLLVSNPELGCVIASRNKTCIGIWLTLILTHDVIPRLKNGDILKSVAKVLSDNQKMGTTCLLEAKLSSSLSSHYDEYSTFFLPDTTVQAYESTILVMSIMPSVKYLSELSTKFNKLTKALPTTNLIINTVHSAKGLEYPNVLVVDDWFNNPQLDNMKFVAWTRAETNLVYLHRNIVTEYKSMLDIPDDTLSGISCDVTRLGDDLYKLKGLV